MGIISDTTSGKTNIDTKVTPFDNIKEVFVKAFGSLFNKINNSGEFFSLKNNEVCLNNRKVEINFGKEYLEKNYDANKYLGDSRAHQCNPSEHIVRNMSPNEMQRFLNGETIQPIHGIISSVLHADRNNICFSPETPVYLGNTLENSPFRSGVDISPETIEKAIKNNYNEANSDRHVPDTLIIAAKIKHTNDYSIENVQKTIEDYYQIKEADLFNPWKDSIEDFTNWFCNNYSSSFDNTSKVDEKGSNIGDDEKYYYSESRFSLLYREDFPKIENIQVVFQVNDASILNEKVYTDCIDREGIDPCFGNSEAHIEERESGMFTQTGFWDTEVRLPEYNQEMLTPIAVEGINVEGMSIDNIKSLIQDLMDTKNDGLSIDDFMGEHPELEYRYDNSNIVSLEDYHSGIYSEEYIEKQKEYGDDENDDWDDWDDYSSNYQEDNLATTESYYEDDLATTVRITSF